VSQPDLLPASTSIKKLFGQVPLRVHVLYKRAEIPANKAIPAFAVSVTYRKRLKAANPGSIPVSATNSFLIRHLQKTLYEIGLASGPQKMWPRLEWKSSSCRMPGSRMPFPKTIRRIVLRTVIPTIQPCHQPVNGDCLGELFALSSPTLTSWLYLAAARFH
jgi:hypothetical protein